MQYHKQLNKHDPENGTFGDCYRTAIACILNKHPSEVPHILSLEDDQLQSREINKYLKSLGLRKIHTAFNIPTLEGMLAYGLHSIPDMHWMLGGISGRGFAHTVVCFNNEIIHDPHPSGSGVCEPIDGYWHVNIIVKPI